MRWSRPVAGPDVSVVVSNETVVALNSIDWGQADAFDQNRAFVGLGWQLNPKLRLEGGYLNQRIDNSFGPDRDNDILTASVFASF